MIFQLELDNSLRANSEKTAIESTDGNLSYAALLEASRLVSDQLIRQGAQKGTPVGTLVKDRQELICVMIGCFYAGCIFVPLDAGLPAKRLATMAQELNLEHLVSSRDLPIAGDPHIFGPAVRLHYVEDILTTASAEGADGISYPEYDPDDSLYIYFTSGSTGVPKGIIGRNASLLQFLQWEIAEFDLGRGVRVSQLISPYFDAFLRDIFVPLLTGGTICLPPAGEDFFTPGQLPDWIDSKGIELIHCVPSLFRLLSGAELTTDHFPGLRYVLLSGEKINPSGLADWYKVFGPRIQLVNLYGATETTMIRAFYRIRPEDTEANRIPIGAPIADTELQILDADFRPCDPLIPGEIYIVSDYLAKGYLNNPELTRERFVKLDAGQSGARNAFRTGDKGRILADGQIDLIGREDRQVKLRGVRVELDEIEAVLQRAENLEGAAVVKRLEQNGDESIVAFVVLKEFARGSAGWQESLAALVKEWLPAYMVPAEIIQLTGFPLLSNGKIDYKTLGQRSALAPVVLPDDATEEKLLSIWKEILGDKSISVEDSFHKIGGNSLSIMKLIGRIYKEYKVRVSLNDLFNNLTIRKQAELVRQANKDNLYLISRAVLKPAYYVSAAQERIYYNQQLNKDGASYNLPMIWQVTGEVDSERIEQVFRRLIDRHEALRTGFSYQDGELLQFVLEEIDFRVDRIETGQSLHEAIRAFVRPFDLGKAPLVRCGIIESAEGRKLLVADFHHIICDGLSQANLLNDMVAFYNGREPDQLALQYKDYAEWEHKFRATDEYLAQREFWLSNFEGDLPRLELPVMRSATGVRSEEGRNFTIEISKSALMPLLEGWNRQEVTMSSGFFSLYFLFLAQITGQEDIVIGMASSGRMQQGLEPVVGMFVKTLPIRCRMDPEQTFNDLAKAINGYLMQAYSKQIYDLSNMVIELNADRGEPVQNLFDVMFVYQGFEKSSHSEGAIEFSRYPFETGTAKYPITLFVFDDDHSFGFKWEYMTDYFTPADIELLAGQFANMAASVAMNPGSPIIDIIGSREPAKGLVEDDISFNF